jgi:hypothetical protein
MLRCIHHPIHAIKNERFREGESQVGGSEQGKGIRNGRWVWRRKGVAPWRDERML